MPEKMLGRAIPLDTPDPLEPPGEPPASEGTCSVLASGMLLAFSLPCSSSDHVATPPSKALAVDAFAEEETLALASVDPLCTTTALPGAALGCLRLPEEQVGRDLVVRASPHALCALCGHARVAPHSHSHVWYRWVRARPATLGHVHARAPTAN